MKFLITLSSAKTLLPSLFFTDQPWLTKEPTQIWFKEMGRVGGNMTSESKKLFVHFWGNVIHFWNSEYSLMHWSYSSAV